MTHTPLNDELLGHHAFRVRNCEHSRHFCQFGSRPNGDCLKPGEARVARVRE